MKILITGSRLYSATLELVRNLAENGHEVYAADTFKHSATNYSNAVKKRFIVPSPRQSELKFINSLIDIINSNEIDYYIPCIEEIIYVAKHLNKIKQKCSKVFIFTDSYDKLLNLHNKREFYKLMDQLKINYPELLDINDITEEKVFKPIYSRFGLDNQIFKDKSKLKVKFDPKKHLAQKYIDGELLCTYSVYNKGQKKISICYNGTLYLKNHPYSNVQTIQNEKVINIVDKICRYLNFTGQIGFDFIKTSTGELYIIDCNPRITSGISLVSQYNDIFSMFFEDNFKPIYKDSTAKFFGLIICLPFAGKINHKNIGKFFKVLFRYREVVFSLKDLKPYLISYLQTIYSYRYAIKNKISFKQAWLDDITFNG